MTCTPESLQRPSGFQGEFVQLVDQQLRVAQYRGQRCPEVVIYRLDWCLLRNRQFRYLSYASDAATKTYLRAATSEPCEASRCSHPVWHSARSFG